MDTRVKRTMTARRPPGARPGSAPGRSIQLRASSVVIRGGAPPSAAMAPFVPKDDRMGGDACELATEDAASSSRHAHRDWGGEQGRLLPTTVLLPTVMGSVMAAVPTTVCTCDREPRCGSGHQGPPFGACTGLAAQGEAEVAVIVTVAPVYGSPMEAPAACRAWTERSPKGTMVLEAPRDGCRRSDVRNRRPRARRAVSGEESVPAVEGYRSGSWVMLGEAPAVTTLVYGLGSKLVLLISTGMPLAAFPPSP